jgi:hypothetical protein
MVVFRSGCTSRRHVKSHTTVPLQRNVSTTETALVLLTIVSITWHIDATAVTAFGAFVYVQNHGIVHVIFSDIDRVRYRKARSASLSRPL